MEIRDFAERLLFSDSLHDKLWSPESFTDETPLLPSFSTPRFPMRPHALRLERWNEDKKEPFPGVDALASEKVRGKVLHFFANHELLAIELMALALLKFPDAPAAFRSGIVRTILEEQSHMRMYANRMAEFGVEFGEIPVNDFFWSCLSMMESPLDFVAHMSLTFEQANLDYSLYYAKAFGKVGDKPSEDLLNTVFKDEVGHVKHGYIWFQRWKEMQENDWDAYVKLLRFPLTPSRAKGLCFLPEVRREIGFSERYISELQVFAHTKGRPPSVFLYNPCAEIEVAKGNADFSLSPMVQSLCDDFESLMVFLAAGEDIILVRKKPTTEFLTELKRVGFAVGEFMEWSDSTRKNLPANLQSRRLGAAEPWGWSPVSKRVFQIIAETLPSDEVTRRLYSKVTAAEVAAHVNDSVFNEPTWAKGIVATSVTEILAAAHGLPSQISHVVVKAPYSSSGRDRLIFPVAEVREEHTNWMKKTVQEFGAVVVEPWLSKVADFSFQLKVLDESSVALIGLTRFLNDARGQYLGTVVGKPLEGLAKEALLFLHGHGSPTKSVLQRYEETAKDIALRYANLGHRGPMGIDAMLYRYLNEKGESEFGFRPLLEVNPRYTMGRVALAIGKRVVPGRFGVWCHIRLKDITSSSKEFETFVKERWPLVVDKSGHIRSGILFTNDPVHASQFLSLLIVGRECFDSFVAEFGLSRLTQQNL